MTDSHTAEVVLLSPPYDYPPRPSIALGIFTVCLNEAGISSVTLYPMFRMAELTGMDNAMKFFRLPPQAMFEEYLFSHRTGLRNGDNLDAYVEFVAKLQRAGKSGEERDDPETLKQWMRAMRGIADQVTEETAREIISFTPRVLAVSSVFYQLNGALAIIRRVKELAPHVRTLIGGPNCMGEPGGAILRYCKDVDAVFFGEGDEVFAETIRALEDDAPLPYGVLRRCDLTPEMTAATDFPLRLTKDMDTVPTPDYDAFYELFLRIPDEQRKQMYVNLNGRYSEMTLLMEGSRGCWWGEKRPCTFCGLNGIKNVYRRRSAKRIFHEMERQVQRYHTAQVEFTDNVLPTRKPDDLLSMMEQSPLAFHAFAEVKPLLKEAEMLALRRAGFTTLQIGIETLNGHLLSLLNKGGSVAQNISALKSCAKAGIRLFWNMLIHIPGEQREDYENMSALIPLLFHLPPPTGFTEINYERRGAYVLEAGRFGLEPVPLPGYRYVFGDAPEMIAGFAQHYIDTGPEEQRIQRETVSCYEPLIRLLRQWSTVYYTKCPKLMMADRGDYLAITDTRPCRKMNLCLVKGIAREIALFCNEPRTLDAVLKEMRTVTPEDVEDCLQWLTESRYMVGTGGRYLTLAILSKTEKKEKGETGGTLSKEKNLSQHHTAG